MFMSYTSFMTSKCQNQRHNLFGQHLWYSMHYDALIYALERKVLRKTSVTQANTKVMFHTTTSL